MEREAEASAFRYLLEGGLMVPSGRKLRELPNDLKLQGIYSGLTTGSSQELAPIRDVVATVRLVVFRCVVLMSLFVHDQVDNFHVSRPISGPMRFDATTLANLVKAYQDSYKLEFKDRPVSNAYQRYRSIEIQGADMRLLLNQDDFVQVCHLRARTLAIWSPCCAHVVPNHWGFEAGVRTSTAHCCSRGTRFEEVSAKLLYFLFRS
jgi:hypothetical protein